MREILGKGGICQLEELAKEGFKKCELYFTERDFEKKPKNNIIDIFSMHEWKGRIRIDGFCTWANIGDNWIPGDRSERLLRRQIQYAQSNDIIRFVFHPGFVNVFVCNREDALRTVVRRLKRIYNAIRKKNGGTFEVKLCVENSEFRPDITAYHNERLVVNADQTVKLLELARKEYLPLSVVVDIEHLYVSALFTPLYNELREYYEPISCLSTCTQAKQEANKKAEERLLEYSRSEDCEVQNQISRFVTDYFKKLGPWIEAVHVCGSDYKNYGAKKDTTTAGSHLPICYNGYSNGVKVKDRVDHGEYLRLLDKYVDKQTPLIIEVSGKPNQSDYLRCVNESRDKLHEILCRHYKAS